jgi:hypothetical protein
LEATLASKIPINDGKIDKRLGCGDLWGAAESRLQDAARGATIPIDLIAIVTILGVSRQDHPIPALGRA